MGSKRTASIRIETFEITTVRRRPSSLRARCAACAAEVEMLSLKSAAEWAALPLATISGWLEAGKLHMEEIAPGWLYVCRNALERQVKEEAANKEVRILPRATAKANARGN
ncbi:MAG TPA: hypothetical protein VG028_00390 [Terriglobia bacterium]|nr:hypothetical protein [Terriglobia bacterium]